MKKSKKIKLNAEVHYSIHNRKVFKGKMWLMVLILVLILLGCAAMFTFGNVTWNPDEGFSPAANPKNWWQILLVVLGAVITVGAILAYVLVCYFTMRRFYNTQAEYWKSNEFKKRKAAALKVELYKLKKKDLKWYKKLGYINADQKRQALADQKKWKLECKSKKQKINYVLPKA